MGVRVASLEQIRYRTDSVQINSNIVGLNSQRALNRTGSDLARSIQRLSSGLRINSAKDDAAGVAIASRMTSQIRGLNQAARNANDGVSLLQTGEGAMASITTSLQRARELAVQASNATNSASDRSALANEMQQLMAEIDRISGTTQFNGERIFDQSTTSIRGDANQAAVRDYLRLGWLEEPESLIRQYFGLQSDGAAISIELTTFTDGAGGTAARVVGSGADGNGRIGNLQMQIDMADFVPPNLPDGGTAPFYNDRIIAHEMVHAVQYRSLNVASIAAAPATSTWFLEGMAEFIHGADERVAADITASGSVANLITNNSISSWDGDSASYSTAYIAMRYLHEQLKTAGYSGVKDMFTWMSTNSATLDAAFTQFLGIDHATFRANFQAAAVNFVNTRMNLTNTDTGGVGGLDADNGSVRTAKTVLSDVGSRPVDNPLANFAETFESVGTGQSGSRQLAFQVGADRDQTIVTTLGAVNVTALGLGDIDITAAPQRAMLQIDDALAYINGQRAEVGAQMARMEMSISNLQSTSENVTASRARILDADYASETATLVRAQILQRAGAAMLAQANALPQMVLSLLRN